MDTLCAHELVESPKHPWQKKKQYETQEVEEINVSGTS
jgi:hypothetical protein